MGIVNALKFNEHAGAILADEEYWLKRRRKSYFVRKLFQILDAPVREKLRLEIIYGGDGNPSLHYEIVKKSQQLLNKKLGSNKNERVTVEKLGLEILAISHEVIQRRVNDFLKFIYGFTIDELNQGYFEKDKKKYNIAQKSVKDHALKIIAREDDNPHLKEIFASRAVIMGWDEHNGLSAFYLNFKEGVLSFNSGGFEAIGSGKYASGISIGSFLNHKTLKERRAGYDQLEGIVELVLSGLKASAHFQEVGGYLNFVYIDGRQSDPAARCREVTGDRAKLASEIVLAFDRNELSKEHTLELLKKLIFKAESLESVENEMFKKAANTQRLNLILEGYKVN